MLDTKVSHTAIINCALPWNNCLPRWLPVTWPVWRLLSSFNLQSQFVFFISTVLSVLKHCIEYLCSHVPQVEEHNALDPAHPFN